MSPVNIYNAANLKDISDGIFEEEFLDCDEQFKKENFIDKEY